MKKRKQIKIDLSNGKINFLIGTHSLFQKDILFNKLGMVIIDEQHKFGVKQRIELALKGGNNCDILLMSATPIPRTLVLTFYGDMDVSKLIEKPSKRKEIITLSKPEEKITEILKFIEKNLAFSCPICLIPNEYINFSSEIFFLASIEYFKFDTDKFPHPSRFLIFS